MIDDNEETIRKIGWTAQSWRNNWDAVKKNKHLLFKKFTPLSSTERELWEDLEERMFAHRKMEILSSSTRKEEYIRAECWRRTLKSNEGGFLLCDKNLGVKYVNGEEYEFLHNRECSKYITITRERMLIEEDTGDWYNDAVKQIRKDKKRVLYEVAEELPHSIGRNRRTCIKEDGKLIVDAWDEIVLNLLFNTDEQENVGRIPKLKLLVKVHKDKKDGHWQTRPIVPSCTLPEYKLSKWIGGILAKYAKLIPWVLDCTEDFQNWLTTKRENNTVFSTYDFTNLFGSEPVLETMRLLDEALDILPFEFTEDDDVFIWNLLKKRVTIPKALQKYFHEPRAKAIVVFTLICVAQTVMCIDNGREVKIAFTDEFLAMGSGPVAPVSNITLALKEYKKLGIQLCTRGMKRYIDDIITRDHLISEDVLRSIYPEYLTLNKGNENVYLDIEFRVINGDVYHWLYTKPFPVIPLNFKSNHPKHTIINACKNELLRMIERTNLTNTISYAVELWYVKYSLADYPQDVLSSIIQEVASVRWRREKRKQDFEIKHIMRYNGTDSNVNRTIQRMTGFSAIKVWKTQTNLQSMAIKLSRTDVTEDNNRILSSFLYR